MGFAPAIFVGFALMFSALAVAYCVVASLVLFALLLLFVGCVVGFLSLWTV